MHAQVNEFVSLKAQKHSSLTASHGCDTFASDRNAPLLQLSHSIHAGQSQICAEMSKQGHTGLIIGVVGTITHVMNINLWVC